MQHPPRIYTGDYQISSFARYWRNCCFPAQEADTEPSGILAGKPLKGARRELFRKAVGGAAYRCDTRLSIQALPGIGIPASFTAWAPFRKVKCRSKALDTLPKPDLPQFTRI